VRKRLLLAVAFLAACAVAGTNRPSRLALARAPAVAGPIIALNIQPPDGRADTVLSLLRSGRVKHVRVSWWRWSAPRDWAWLPRYRAAGVEVLPLIYPGTDAAASAGASMAARYRALFDAFGPFPYVQLGNEADGAGPFGIPGADAYRQGRRWAAQVREAARLIHQFDPAVKIVAGGVAWVHPGTLDFVRGQLEGGGFDVFAMHIYGIGCAGEPLSRYTAVRSLGWTGPIWTTEIGVNWAQAAFVRRDRDGFQAEQLRACLTEDPSRHGYERLYWFQLTPDPEGYGILEPDFSPRPAYDWLRSRP
jgi:hypothetical protein